MGKATGFKEYARAPLGYRPAQERRLDFLEIYSPPSEAHLHEQSARCMDCGVPFCQSPTGCPLGNQIPEWNHSSYLGDMRSALRSLEATNNFPEFTGRVCPGPCEGACVLGIDGSAVTIREIEYSIAERGWQEGWIAPKSPTSCTGKSVAVVGSGPAGLAAAQELNRLGHIVTIFEREDRPGGLLTYGIPNMKLDKGIVERRIKLLEAEGVVIRLNADIGRSVSIEGLIEENDAVLLAIGAGQPRDVPVPGRALQGVHFAMDYLTASTRALLAGQEGPEDLNAKDRRVLVIGAGDTATDCIATAVRQGCSAIVNVEITQKPPTARAGSNPWPEWPRVLRTEYGHYEAIDVFGDDPRHYGLKPTGFIDDGFGRVGAVETAAIGPSAENGRAVFLADLALIAAGFVGPERYLLDQVEIVPSGERRFETSHPKVFSAGDCRRGQSLVVWAIEEGRGAARAIHAAICGLA